MAERREFTRLMEPVDKIYQIDEHIGLVFSGLPSDARVLIDRARLEAQINRITYDEPISVESLVKAICDIIEKGISPEKVEAGIADVKTKRFRKLTQDEIAKLIEKYRRS